MDVTHTTWSRRAPKSAMMPGVATATMVWSRRIMKKPRQRAARARQAWGAGRTVDAAGVVLMARTLVPPASGTLP
ncbi:hypothetical protein GCM10010980_08150 [Corynebacterium marinum]|nr:hypothetical protein GCM10010980_08150 [Corynebacterium marinum]